MKKVKELEAHINYYYNPRAQVIKGQNKHQYIKELIKDLKYDADVYEQNPFKKYGKIQLHLFYVSQLDIEERG